MNTCIISLTVLVLFFGAFLSPTNAQQNIPDQATLDQIIAAGGFQWDENLVEGQPDYIFNQPGQVYIVNGAQQLLIDDGTIVHLAPNVVIRVQGLMASRDDVGNGVGFSQTILCGTDENNPAQQPWGSIEVWGNNDPQALDNFGKVDLTNCLLSGGGAGPDWAIGLPDWGSLIRLMSPPGLQDGVPDLRLTDCTLQRSQQHGIVVSSENDIWGAYTFYVSRYIIAIMCPRTLCGVAVD